MWMRSACRIVCWCWIWMHLGLVNLGSVGRGDGDGIGVLVCWCRCVSLPLLLFLVVVVCSWQVPPRSAAIAPACHRGPPSSLAIHANRSALAALAASMSHEPSALPRSHFSSFCSSLFLRRRQTADGRLQTAEPDGRRLFGGLWRCRVAHDPWSRNCQREALRNQGTCPTRRRSRNRW
jgi:hypothetical protein